MSTTPPQVADVFRRLALVLALSPLLICGAVAFTIPTEGAEPVPPWLTGAIVAAVVLGFALAETLGSRVSPLTADESSDAAALSIARYRTSMMLRFVLTEWPIIATIAVCFVLDHGPWPLVLAVAVGVPVLAYEIWPSGRNVRRVADRLEAGGVRSGLRETFGV